MFIFHFWLFPFVLLSHWLTGNHTHDSFNWMDILDFVVSVENVIILELNFGNSVRFSDSVLYDVVFSFIDVCLDAVRSIHFVLNFVSKWVILISKISCTSKLIDLCLCDSTESSSNSGTVFILVVLVSFWATSSIVTAIHKFFVISKHVILSFHCHSIMSLLNISTTLKIELESIVFSRDVSMSKVGIVFELSSRRWILSKTTPNVIRKVFVLCIDFLKVMKSEYQLMSLKKNRKTSR